MKVKVAVEYEIELEVNDPAVRELRDWYKDHPVAYWNDVPEGLMDKTEKIESQEELKTLLGEIKQYNSEYAYLSNSERKYKKLITE